MNRQDAKKLMEKAYIERETDDHINEWKTHSYNVAYIAETLGKLAGLDPEKCYVMGLLHDIGRTKFTNIRHSILGYKIMKENNVPEEISRIAITHLYILQDGSNLKNQYHDYGENEQEFVENYLKDVEYTDYDKLIQISDLLADTKIKTIEERMFSVFCRYDILNSIGLCKKIQELKDYFESKIGSSIYLPFKDKIISEVYGNK